MTGFAESAEQQVKSLAFFFDVGAGGQFFEKTESGQGTALFLHRFDYGRDHDLKGYFAFTGDGKDRKTVWFLDGTDDGPGFG